MDVDPTYWQGINRLPIYDQLMPLLACQKNATAKEGQMLIDTSACNWFLSRALKMAYNIDDFIPRQKDEWLSANTIYDYVSSSSEWSNLGSANDQKVLSDAAAGAENGQPVIAVRKGNPHGHVALVLGGPLTYSSNWKMKVPNSASFFLSANKIVNRAYVGCKLSYAFDTNDAVEIFWRVKRLKDKSTDVLSNPPPAGEPDKCRNVADYQACVSPEQGNSTSYCHLIFCQ